MGGKRAELGAGRVVELGARRVDELGARRVAGCGNVKGDMLGVCAEAELVKK